MNVPLPPKTNSLLRAGHWRTDLKALGQRGTWRTQLWIRKHRLPSTSVKCHPTSSIPDLPNVLKGRTKLSVAQDFTALKICGNSRQTNSVGGTWIHCHTIASRPRQGWAASGTGARAHGYSAGTEVLTIRPTRNSYSFFLFEISCCIDNAHNTHINKHT